MSLETRRISIRVLAITLQWIALTTAVGALAIRSDIAFARIITPQFGPAPALAGALVAAFLLGLTITSPKTLGLLTLLMCVAASSFVALVLYAPVWDGTVIRTAGLDNFAMQRVALLTILVALAAVPGAAFGNLAGDWLNVRQEILADPRDLNDGADPPWWERREGSSSG